MAFSIEERATDLVSLEFAKAWAKTKMAATPEDDLLILLIQAASENIEEEIDLETITRGAITEDHSIWAPDVPQIWTLQRPIISVTEVNNDVNLSFGAGTKLATDEFIVDKDLGRITRVASGGSWPSVFTMGLNATRIIYSSGVADKDAVPVSLKSACMETVAVYYYHITREQFGVNSISDDEGNRSFVSFDFLPKPVMKKLGKYPYRKLRGKRITGKRVSVA